MMKSDFGAAWLFLHRLAAIVVLLTGAIPLILTGIAVLVYFLCIFFNVPIGP